MLTEGGTRLFPPYAVRTFGSGERQVRVAFIGMTLEGTPAVVTPAGVAGLSFRDEAETVNALVPELRAQGIEAIVVIVHEGAETGVGYNDKSCGGLTGEPLPVLDRLDLEVDLVVSGHTHRAYVCDYGRINPAKPVLLTSAGQYGTLLTDITLLVEPRTGEVVDRRADNLIVQGEGHGDVAVTEAYPRYERHQKVAALVDRYAAAAAPLAARQVGKLSAPARREPTPAGEHALGALVADAQLAATRDPEMGGSQIAFMNPGGIRADLVPGSGGAITYGQLFAVQPFGNNLVVKSLTGRQIRMLLEQQFANPAMHRVLQVSSSLRYGYDLSRPAGERIIDPRVNGAPLEEDAVYRVTMNGFLASGGDGFTILREGTDPLGGPQDVDALEAYIASADTIEPPVPERIRDLTPR